MTGTNTTRIADRVLSRCRQIADCTDIPGETTRTFLSPPMHRVQALLRDWMEAAGMTVRVDAAGNLRGLRPGSSSRSPRLLIGSHLDTVPNAGAFDGILGVVLGVAVVEELRSQHLPFAIEVIGFSEEEGVRFNKPFLGSLALIGELDNDTLTRTDRNGVSVAEAIRIFGLNPAELPAATMSNEAFAYLEIHIEQGPLLESEDAPLGIVDALAGQTRMSLTFDGRANHAGTTPMHLRHDAMAAASAWIVSVEDYANAHDGLVATVGRVETIPGAGNVIAGQVKASLDLRHASDSTRNIAAAALLTIAKTAAAKRGVQLTTHTQLEQPAVPMDPHLTSLLQQAAAEANVPSRRMTGGAGHDAMIVAKRLPCTMLFVRSPKGLSHHPDESVLPQDIEAAFTTAIAFLGLLSEDQATPKDDHA